MEKEKAREREGKRAKERRNLNLQEKKEKNDFQTHHLFPFCFWLLSTFHINSKVPDKMTRPVAAVLLLSLLALAAGAALAAEDPSSGDASAPVGAVLIARKVCFFFCPIDRMAFSRSFKRRGASENSPLVLTLPTLIEKTVRGAPAPGRGPQRDGDCRGLQRRVEVIFPPLCFSMAISRERPLFASPLLCSLSFCSSLRLMELSLSTEKHPLLQINGSNRAEKVEKQSCSFCRSSSPALFFFSLGALLSLNPLFLPLLFLKKKKKNQQRRDRRRDQGLPSSRRVL